MRLAGYLAAGAGVCLVAVLLAVAGGVNEREAFGAAGAAWGIQAVASVPLLRSLDAGRNAGRQWVAGMVERATALLIALALVNGGIVSRDAAITFGLSLTALIIMEAVWLAAVPAPGAPRDKTRE